MLWDRKCDRTLSTSGVSQKKKPRVWQLGVKNGCCSEVGYALKKNCAKHSVRTGVCTIKTSCARTKCIQTNYKPKRSQNNAQIIAVASRSELIFEETDVEALSDWLSVPFMSVDAATSIASAMT